MCATHYSAWQREQNPGKQKEYTDAWRKNNPDKIKASNAIRRKRYKGYSSSITRNQVLDLLETQKACAACKTEFNEEVKATLDHKIPISKGGAHDKDNLHLLCFPCNASKKDKTWEEFLEWNQRT